MQASYDTARQRQIILSVSLLSLPIPSSLPTFPVPSSFAPMRRFMLENLALSVLMPRSFRYRFRPCGAPSAKPRIHTPHKPAVGVVTYSNHYTTEKKKSPPVPLPSSHRIAEPSFFFSSPFCVFCLQSPETGTSLATPHRVFTFFWRRGGDVIVDPRWM